MSDFFTRDDYEQLNFPLKHKVQKHWLWGLFGFIHVNNLDKLPNIYKRLDELRETIFDIHEKTDLFQKYPAFYEVMMDLDVLHQTLIWKRFSGERRTLWHNETFSHIHVRDILDDKYKQYFLMPYSPKTPFARFLYRHYQYIHKSQIADLGQLAMLTAFLKRIIDAIIKGNYFTQKEFWVFDHLKNIEEYLEWINRLVTDG